MPTAFESFKRFEKKHGKRVQVELGFWLFPDGAFAEIPDGDTSMASYGCPGEGPAMLSPRQLSAAKLERATNVVRYHETLLDKALEEFHEFKHSIDDSDIDESDIALLEEHRDEVTKCRQILRKAERSLKRLQDRPTPAQRKLIRQFENAHETRQAKLESRLRNIEV